MWTRIENGRVVELTDSDPDGRYHPDLLWVTAPADAPAGAIVGMTYDAGTFGPRPDDVVAPPLSIAKADLVERLADADRLRAVRALLKLGRPDEDLDDAELRRREWWEAASEFRRDDQRLTELLAQAGCDPDMLRS